MVFSLGIAEMIKHIGDKKFCTVCHTMEPMALAYEQDVHGGKNKTGFTAECNACHLPHDNILHYMYKKAEIGLHDVRVQIFGDLKSIDWEKSRKHAKDYVFDSGCLSCHENLKDATMSTPKGYLAHRSYFLKFTDKKCVECHQNVGHKALGLHLVKISHKKDQ